jgi:predicted transcriptional regulator
VHYRDEEDIYAEMLEIALLGARQTKIMYGANLSHLHVRRHLKFLTNRDMIRYSKKTKIYVTTERGVAYLDKYEQMARMFPVPTRKLKAANQPSVVISQ